jgi:hypothetical protein
MWRGVSNDSPVLPNAERIMRHEQRKEDRAMPSYITRKRLKKKMLDRWENEGGRIPADPTSADENRSTSDHQNEGKQLSASHDESAVGTPASPTKKRKPTQK